jgi:hypothetical protein
MKNLTNGVDIQGMGNTMDFKTVLTLYSSSFTEGFIKVLETYNTPINKYIEVKHKEIPIENSVRIKTVMNKGFEKLKNSLLREKLQKCEGLQFNPKLHVRVRDLKYKSIYDLDSLSKKKWIDFFTKGNVYVDINNSSSRISQRIFFDKSIVQFFGRTDNSLN